MLTVRLDETTEQRLGQSLSPAWMQQKRSRQAKSDGMARAVRTTA